MKSKTYLYLGILAVLLVAAYFLTTDSGEKTTSYKLPDTKLFELDSVKVDKIEIVNKDGKVVLEKTSGEWRVVEPYNYKIAATLAENAVSGLKNMKLESIISTNPEKKDMYGLSETDQAEVTVYESGVPKGKFLLGKSSAGTSSYVKKPDSDNIYIADKLNMHDLVKAELNDWRDRGIISIPKEAINSVQYISGGETFLVSKDTTGKFFIGKDSVSGTFEGILNTLQKLETNNFKDSTITDFTGFNEAIVIDWGTKTELKFLKLDSAPVKYLLKVSGNDQIFLLEESNAKNILKTQKEILGK